MEYRELVERIQTQGYEKPRIVMLTPEIRTIDKKVMHIETLDVAQIVSE